MILLRRLVCAALFLGGTTAAGADSPPTAEEVPVPGGPAAIRRLLNLDSSRLRETFFLDLHEALLAGAEWDAGWSQIERRRAVVDFVEDLATFRREFGRKVTIAFSRDGDRERSRRVLAWLGLNVKSRGAGFAVETRDDARRVRRRAFLDAAAATSPPALMTRLAAGESVVISPVDETAPLPFGLATWRELLDEPRLSAGDAFLELVKDVAGSRLLVTLHALDPETREGLRAIARAHRSSVLRDQDVLDRLARFPGALALSGGRLVLPGGRDADPVWEDVFGVPPSKPDAFLYALFKRDAGRGAYVVEVLQQLPEPVAHALIFGPVNAAGTGPAGLHPPQSTHAVARVRKLYRAVEETRRAIDVSRRDPYDFAHLARFLRAGASGEITLLPLALDGETFPKSESELAEIVGQANRRAEVPEDALARLVRGDVGGGSDAPRAVRRFLLVSSLLEGRPALEDRGVVALLLRGADRFGSAYAVLEDAPFQDPALARRYLFTLDRLDRRKPSRESEVAAALFQAGAELLASGYRAGSLDDRVAAGLFSELLDLPLFARADVPPGKGERELFGWLSAKLNPAFARTREAAGKRTEGAQDESPALSDEEDSPDALLSRGLVGFAPPAVFEWNGGHYRFDSAADELGRRNGFREKQRLASLDDLAAVHRELEALFAAAGAGDRGAAVAAASALADRLALSAESGAAGAREDERILEEYEKAREALERVAKISRPIARAQVAKDLAPVDVVVAERLLEALLGHVYAAAAGDPDDLYYEDPDFVRRHSFATVEKGGRTVESPFSPTMLTSEATGGGSRVAGSLFGLADVLGLLHADQITYAPGAMIANENIRSGLIGSVRRVSAARLDDDALSFVASACRATEEIAAALATRGREERFRVWRELAKDLVARSRLAILAELRAEEISPASLARFLSPSDLYRIGRRIARGDLPSLVAVPEAAVAARQSLARLEQRLGPAGARDRLAEFGPRAVAWAGRGRLTDLDMPPYEVLAAYRRPQLFADRLYDWKIAVARTVADAGLPAAVLPLVLPRAVDEMMSDLKMAFPYDWSAIVRRSSSFGAADLGRLLDEGLQAGRLLRDHARDARGGTR